MRKLIFIFLLLCGATQAMAADLCERLQGKALSIDANGFHGVISIDPIGINLVNQNNTFTFQAVVQFGNDPGNPVKGQCKNRHITFTRTGAGFVQNYDGWIFEQEPLQMAGTFSHNGTAKNWGWYAKMEPVIH